MTGDFPPEAMGALVRETFRAMVKRVEHQFDDMDLVLSQWLALKLTGAGTISCVGDVTRELGLETGASTRLIDHLENRGLLVRRRSVIDRRVVGVALTEQGIAVLEDIQRRLARFWQEELGIFSEIERNLLFDMLTRLRNRLVIDQSGVIGPEKACR